MRPLCAVDAKASVRQRTVDDRRSGAQCHMPERTPPSGLTHPQAAQRLKADGPNRLEAVAVPRFWLMVKDVAREPMFQMLVAAGLLYLWLGSLGEALMLLGFVAATVGITLFQGQRAERALQALKTLASPRAEVVRGGQRMRISGNEVVRGDLIHLSEGDRVAADAWLHTANQLRLDESLLTGEAVAVDKTQGPPAALAAAAGYAQRSFPAAVSPAIDERQRLSMVYAGTLVVAGQGLAQVLATGGQTEMGRIGRALTDETSPPTPLALQTRRLVKLFSVAGLTLSVLVLVLYGLWRDDWFGGLLAGITLAMSMLPEEFLLILTVFMAMGAWRLSQQRVLTRRAATIEALGAATVLCADKTGTLTQNQMAIAELAAPATGASANPFLIWTSAAGTPSVVRARAGASAPTPAAPARPQALQAPLWAATSRTEPLGMPQPIQDLLACGVLASEPEPFDAMDKAFLALGNAQLPATIHQGWVLAHDHGLDPQLRVMTHVWRNPNAPAGAAAHVAVKGAHESVLALCRLDDAGVRQVERAAGRMAARGLRVLAVASGSVVLPPEPAQDTGRVAQSAGRLAAPLAGYGLHFMGLVGLADPLRLGVPEAVYACRSAGIRVVMITGDHSATAQAMAQQAGLDASQPVLTGADVQRMDDAALRQSVQSVGIFARVLPEHKLRIVQALKANGEIVAMTGDGVNDAPSLKAAHIGVAMGQRGTDVAREASSLVLLDDDFGAIVGAVRLGRRIYDNLVKAMGFAFAVHVPIAGLSVLPLFFGLPLVLTPVHIAFLELMIDPVCAVVFESEPEEDGLMARPPRPSRQPLFSWALMVSSLAQGALVLLATTALFMGLLDQGVSDGQARATTFTALVACSVALIGANRSLSRHTWAAILRPNRALWRTLAVTAVLLTAVLSVPDLRVLFRFSALTPALLALALGVAFAVFAALAACQPLRSRWMSAARP